MADNSTNNKRIAKNAFFLYLRMLFMMFITLYTSRVVLSSLGIVDYGIFNVVGGVVAMLGFLSGSMSYSVQRFLSFEIGKGDEESTRIVFNSALMAHAIIAMIVVIVMELFGVWYLNNYMNIPTERLTAANFVLQCAIFSTVFTIFQVPYNGILIAKEKMNVFAYFSIIEALLKLGIVYCLGVDGFDKLKLYSILFLLSTVIVAVIYFLYCWKEYKEVKIEKINNFEKLKEIMGFASWNMLGELAWTFTGQGVNMILNLFLGPTVNAARGLSEQVNAAVNRFISSFQTAINPQIVKSYASGNLENMYSLVCRGSKFSFFLMLLISMPLILNMDFVLNMWLKEVPEYTTIFCQIILLCSLITTNSYFLATAAKSNKDIRNYQIVVSIIQALNFPLSYVLLKIGYSPTSTLILNLIIQVFLLWVRMFYAKMMVGLPIFIYIYMALRPEIIVLMSSILLPLVICLKIQEGISSVILISMTSIISSLISIYIWGLTKQERNYIQQFIINKIKK